MFEMTRRDFVSGAGLMFAASALPAYSRETDLPAAFANRGKAERLNLSYARIHVGLDKPFSLLHISDTHLAAAYGDENNFKRRISAKRTQKCFGGMQEESLKESLAWAKKNCDFVLHTGDLIDFQSRANYDLVKKHFGDGFATGCLGNHEYSPDMGLSGKEAHNEAYKDGFRKELASVFPFDISVASRVVNGVNFVSMDDVFGTVTEGQVARFKAKVAKGLPIILCLHVPIMTDDLTRYALKFWGMHRNYRSSAMPLKGVAAIRRVQERDPVTRSFVAYLKSERMLRGILSGHLHFAAEERFSPTAVQYVAPGNYQFCAREVLFD